MGGLVLGVSEESVGGRVAGMRLLGAGICRFNGWMSLAYREVRGGRILEAYIPYIKVSDKGAEMFVVGRDTSDKEKSQCLYVKSHNPKWLAKSVDFELETARKYAARTVSCTAGVYAVSVHVPDPALFAYSMLEVYGPDGGVLFLAMVLPARCCGVRAGRQCGVLEVTVFFEERSAILDIAEKDFSLMGVRDA